MTITTVIFPHDTVQYVVVYRQCPYFSVCFCYLYVTTQSTELHVVHVLQGLIASVVDADTFGTCYRHTIVGRFPGPCRMTTWRVVSFHIILQLVRDLCAMGECAMITPSVYRKTPRGDTSLRVRLYSSNPVASLERFDRKCELGARGGGYSFGCVHF